MQLSPHFTLQELTRSATGSRKGLDNTAPPEVIQNLSELCSRALEPIRAKVGKPLIVLSGYRSEAVNKAVGGAKNSQHRTGNACDFYVQGMSIEDLFVLLQNTIEYDQLIQEFDSWIHVSWNGNNNRNQALRAVKESGKTKYIAA